MCFFRCSCRQYCSRDSVNLSGCGAVGSALPWGGRGRKFKSCHSDQIKSKTNRFRLYFLHFRGKIERFPTTFIPPEIPNFFDHMFDHSWSWCDSFGCFCSGTLCPKNQIQKVPGGVSLENLFLCLLRISFYLYILFIIEKHHVLCYNMAVQLLIPYMTCHCKRHFIEKRSSRPLFIGAYGVAKIQV